MNIITRTDPIKTFSLAIVVSEFNHPVTEPLLSGAIERATEYGFTEEQVLIVKVPGAVEIPLMVQHILRHRDVDAVIALGAVIRGETTHYDYVCDQVSQGCAQLALIHHKPVIFGVLTTENAEQAFARVGGDHGHKGRDAVDCAVHMVNVLQQLCGV